MDPQKIDKRTKEYREAQATDETKMEVSFAHLHTPLFFAGRNWGEKLDVRHTAKGKITMTYDKEEKTLHVRCDGLEAYIPSSNLVSYSPLKNPPLKVQEVSHAGAVPGMNAQVSGPHDHVFAGLGGGQTGMGAKVK